MPELPEVETVVRDLRPRAVGRTVTAVRVGAKQLRKAWNVAWAADVVGRRVAAIRRRGKWIVVEMEGPRIVVHLGMTGQFTAVAAAEPEPDHLHLVFALNDGTELRFRDVRRFGSVTLFADDAAVEAFFAAAGLGPEPFGLDPAAFREVVRASARNLKAILIDQTVVAGVGNIYADEACCRAGLHPARKGDSLTPAECDALRVAVEAVLTTAIAARGSTIRDYVGGSGLGGGFQLEHRVYGRTGEPCLTCGAAIERVVLAGRSSHYCPKCQPRDRGTEGPRDRGAGTRERPRPRLKPK
ncbi:bifunctional DNA-formamidopyrimidine glycosylase/DNA-(apurinic or apyrimidinic site) lyase [Urbifossiella limnaea]|uniref:Formamidopyrimidine-DNA glycosylase n=1 Tax=Urbifossiella limnaea TaxID=2528023 RepID=A0A517Y0C9_9BACT|nr:bifunctional DNA-formamidopyrimidine glycosylase/DNA-(apurinic or apyrimidinic site) lyase [Urbifossiella limnaea]QDU23216.1 Formamidopyrimidine-DNA glycosylase [Urbifossiella limnaea]